MWTLWNAVCFRAFVLVVLLVSGVPAKVRWTPSMGFLVGTPPEDEFLGGDGDVGGHGVAEGNGPNGLYGFFGCRFSYAVCQKNEVCVNDNLFGSCQKIGSPFDRYKYDLNENQVQKLTYEVERLVAEGHKWKDLYTQCVLGNVLLAFELNQHYDSNFCKQKPKPERRRSHPADDVIFSIKRLYLKGPLEEEDDLISDYDGDSGPGFSDNPYDTIYARSPSDPNDRAALKWSKYDFVNVHKYQKNRKREPSLDTIMRHSPSPHQRLPEFLARLTPGEVYFLSQIVKMEGQDDGRHGDNNYDDNFVEDAGNKESEDNEGNLPLQFSLDEEPKQEIDRFADGLQDDDGLRLNSDDIYDNLVFLQQGDQDDHPAKIDEEHDLSEEKYEKRFDDPWPEQVEHEDEANRYAAVGSLDDQNYDVEGVKQLANYLQDETLQGEEDSEDVTVKPVKNYKLPGSDIPADMRPNLEQISDSDVSNNIDEELREERGLVTKSVEITTPKAKYDIVDTSYAYLSVLPKTDSMEFAVNLLVELQGRLQLPPDTFSDLSVFNGDINFRINQNPKGLNASSIAVLALSLSNELKNRTGLQIVGAGIGHVSEAYISVEDVKTNGRKYFLLTFVLCGVIAGVVLAVILLYVIRRHRLSQEKLERPSSQSPEKVEPEASKDYQELCRHHMQTKLSEKPEPLHVAGRIGSVSAMENAPVHSPSSRSSTSSWSEEPVTTSMDISTGHIVLSYMEDHLKNKDRLDEEWDALRAYEPEICSVKVAALPQNERRNRYADVLPYDHSRVVLHSATNMTGSDYINASTITDHDPRNPAYLITQGPLPNTVADFWQMIWEQGSVVIVNLTKLTDQGNSLCHCYWPSEGSDLYHIYEVHLVSEHIWCEDYLVRSFYLRNLQTNETRTVTQFHFQTWPDMKIPGTSKALLDFRRKVNKSYRGRSCPILVHCSDGAGRSGTYCLIDMVLNRMTKGAKEIDIAATLEHIRDQRMLMVKTKEQFQFVLTTVAEEVHAILKALPQ